MPLLSLRPTLSRPRPDNRQSGAEGSGPTGEGGNVSYRVAAMIGSNGLLVTAILLSALLIGAATTAILR